MELYHIFREKCKHAGEMRLFKPISAATPFLKLEEQFLCHDKGLMEVSLAADPNGPWTKLEDDDSLYEAPIGAITKQFPGNKYIKLVCITPSENVSDTTVAPTLTPLNAFDILMQKPIQQGLPNKKTSSSGVKDGLSRKDELYNSLIDWFKDRNLSFLSPQSEGAYITQFLWQILLSFVDFFVKPCMNFKVVLIPFIIFLCQVLTNALWYVTNQQLTINDRSRKDAHVSPIPISFEQFQGFNETRRKKLKSQPLESIQLKSHADALYSLCLRPVMQSTSSWEAAYKDIKHLAYSFMSYHKYLIKQKEKAEVNRNMDHPVRQVSDNTSVWNIPKRLHDVKPEYKLLDKALSTADFNEPVFFDEDIHLASRFENAMQRQRFFEKLQLSVTVDIYKYCPGGGIVTIFCLVKVMENNSDPEKCARIAANMLKIKPKLPEFHTRFMKRQFKERVRDVASVQPALLDLIYKELTLDASVASHPETVQRLRMIFMGETGLLSDLRKLNPGRPSGTFDVFFEKLGELIEEYTAADERRHSTAHMSEILSLKDLVSQTVKKCPEGTAVPSTALVRLQFTPRNPYTHAALSFTSKISIQYKIQRRQLRVSHPDDHFCNALFKYLRNLAVMEDCCLFFCDDKAKIPIGEPDVAISTGVRGKKSLAPSSTTLVSADHDLHQKGRLTPSVYFKCAIPDSTEKSFYRGQVNVIVNDSVFQSSNPMRHAAAVVKEIQNLDEKPTVFLKYSDGGTDHRNLLEHVKCAAICIFKELDLDFYVAARCAPGQSWINPAERIMSILNIGLQNCALSREKCSDETENKLQKCHSLDSIRTLGLSNPDIKDHWEGSIEPVRRIVENRFRRLALKDEPIKVTDPIPENEIDLLTRHLNYLFPGMDTSKLVKSHTKNIDAYNVWLDKHCRQRQYAFQIMKCDDPECCAPSKQKNQWLPDPVLSDDGQHFKSFSEVYGTETNDSDRPTAVIKLPSQSNSHSRKTTSATTNKDDPVVNIVPEDPDLQGDAMTLTAQNARCTVDCKECGKPRVIYSKSKLTERYRLQLALLLSEYDYTCGSPVTFPSHSLHGKVFVRINLTCARSVENAYYSSDVGRKDICYYCGKSEAVTDLELKKSFKTVFPLCFECKEKGFKSACFRPYGKRSLRK